MPSHLFFQGKIAGFPLEQAAQHSMGRNFIEKRSTVGVGPRSVRPLRHMVPRLLLDEQFSPPTFGALLHLMQYLRSKQLQRADKSPKVTTRFFTLVCK